VKLFEHLGQLDVLFIVKVELAQLEFCLKPEPVVLGFLERVQRGLVKVLQQIHLVKMGRHFILKKKESGESK
jgi:hypothetical protein